MIDLTRIPAEFADLAIRHGIDTAAVILASRYYQRGTDEWSPSMKPEARHLVGVGVSIVLDLDDTDPPRLGCHTSWPHQKDKTGDPCRHADHNLPACAGCGRLA